MDSREGGGGGVSFVRSNFFIQNDLRLLGSSRMKGSEIAALSPSQRDPSRPASMTLPRSHSSSSVAVTVAESAAEHSNSPGLANGSSSSPIERVESPTNDIEYGPGIVQKLREKFSQLSNKATVISPHSKRKRFPSVDDILSSDEVRHRDARRTISYRSVNASCNDLAVRQPQMEAKELLKEEFPVGLSSNELSVDGKAAVTEETVVTAEMNEGENEPKTILPELHISELRKKFERSSRSREPEQPNSTMVSRRFPRSLSAAPQSKGISKTESEVDEGEPEFIRVQRRLRKSSSRDEIATHFSLRPTSFTLPKPVAQQILSGAKQEPDKSDVITSCGLPQLSPSARVVLESHEAKTRNVESPRLLSISDFISPPDPDSARHSPAFPNSEPVARLEVVHVSPQYSSSNRSPPPEEPKPPSSYASDVERESDREKCSPFEERTSSEEISRSPLIVKPAVKPVNKVMPTLSTPLARKFIPDTNGSGINEMHQLLNKFNLLREKKTFAEPTVTRSAEEKQIASAIRKSDNDVSEHLTKIASSSDTEILHPKAVPVNSQPTPPRGSVLSISSSPPTESIQRTRPDSLRLKKPASFSETEIPTPKAASAESTAVSPPHRPPSTISISLPTDSLQKRSPDLTRHPVSLVHHTPQTKTMQKPPAEAAKLPVLFPPTKSNVVTISIGDDQHPVHNQIKGESSAASVEPRTPPRPTQPAPLAPPTLTSSAQVTPVPAFRETPIQTSNSTNFFTRHSQDGVHEQAPILPNRPAPPPPSDEQSPGQEPQRRSLTSKFLESKNQQSNTQTQLFSEAKKQEERVDEHINRRPKPYGDDAVEIEEKPDYIHINGSALGEEAQELVKTEAIRPMPEGEPKPTDYRANETEILLEKFSRQRVTAEPAFNDGQNDLLSSTQQFLGMTTAGDGNPVRHSLITLVEEEDVPLLMEAMAEKLNFVFEDLMSTPSSSNGGIIHGPLKRQQRRKMRNVSRIDFVAGPPKVFAYPDENSAVENDQWHPGEHISFDQYQKICEDEREKYEQERIELSKWQAAFVASRTVDPDSILSAAPAQPSANDFTLGVTSRISYTAAPNFGSNNDFGPSNVSLIAGK